MAFVDPVALRGGVVEMTPLERADRSGLVAAAADGELWKLFYPRVPGPDRMDDAIEGCNGLRRRLARS